MTVQELAETLKAMREEKPVDVMTRLFGVLFCAEIEASGLSPASIARASRKLLLVGVVVMGVQTPAEAQRQPGIDLEVGGGFHIPTAHLIHYGFIELPDGPVANVGVARWGERWGVAVRMLAGFGGSVRIDDEPAEGDVYLGRYADPSYLQVYIRYRTERGFIFGFGGGVDGLFGAHFGAFEVLKSFSLTEKVSVHVGATSLGIVLQTTPVALLVWRL